MLSIRRAGFISARSAFYRRFYNLNKIRGLNCLAINRVYKR
jgi:hypothetical protein